MQKFYIVAGIFPSLLQTTYFPISLNKLSSVQWKARKVKQKNFKDFPKYPAIHKTLNIPRWRRRRKDVLDVRADITSTLPFNIVGMLKSENTQRKYFIVQIFTNRTLFWFILLENWCVNKLRLEITRRARKQFKLIFDKNFLCFYDFFSTFLS